MEAAIIPAPQTFLTEESCYYISLRSTHRLVTYALSYSPNERPCKTITRLSIRVNRWKSGRHTHVQFEAVERCSLDKAISLLTTGLNTSRSGSSVVRRISVSERSGRMEESELLRRAIQMQKWPNKPRQEASLRERRGPPATSKAYQIDEKYCGSRVDRLGCTSRTDSIVEMVLICSV